MTTAFEGRTSRVIWRWCVAYTAMAPREQRERRRIELSDHLRESERAGHRQRAVLGAAVAGIPDDVTWSFRLGLARLMRSFLTPVPYLVVAAILPVQGGFYWGNRSGHLAHVMMGVSSIGAAGCLALAALVWFVRRAR